MSNNLLNFFTNKSNELKFRFAFTQSNPAIKIVANYYFNVSNVKSDDQNTIKIDTITDLEIAVKDYFENTDTNYEDKIIFSKNLDESKDMFVTLLQP